MNVHVNSVTLVSACLHVNSVTLVSACLLHEQAPTESRRYFLSQHFSKFSSVSGTVSCQSWLNNSPRRTSGKAANVALSVLNLYIFLRTGDRSGQSLTVSSVTCTHCIQHDAHISHAGVLREVRSHVLVLMINTIR